MGSVELGSSLTAVEDGGSTTGSIASETEMNLWPEVEDRWLAGVATERGDGGDMYNQKKIK